MEKQLYKYHGGTFVDDPIKPCPFCGCEAEIKFKGNDFTKTRQATIKCSNLKCRAEMTTGAIRQSSEWVGTVTIEKWNNRFK